MRGETRTAKKAAHENSSPPFPHSLGRNTRSDIMTTKNRRPVLKC